MRNSHGRLAPCPGSPNCVCSDATDRTHGIDPLPAGADPDATWQALIDALGADPAMTIVEQQPGYLRAEARTRWLRFVDDLELELRAEAGVIAVRSASRVGYSDFGTNRRRVEALRRIVETRR